MFARIRNEGIFGIIDEMNDLMKPNTEQLYASQFAFTGEIIRIFIIFFRELDKVKAMFKGSTLSPSDRS